MYEYLADPMNWSARPKVNLIELLVYALNFYTFAGSYLSVSVPEHTNV